MGFLQPVFLQVLCRLVPLWDLFPVMDWVAKTDGSRRTSIDDTFVRLNNNCEPGRCWASLPSFYYCSLGVNLDCFHDKGDRKPAADQSKCCSFSPNLLISEAWAYFFDWSFQEKVSFDLSVRENQALFLGMILSTYWGQNCPSVTSASPIYAGGLQSVFRAESGGRVGKPKKSTSRHKYNMDKS